MLAIIFYMYRNLQRLTPDDNINLVAGMAAETCHIITVIISIFHNLSKVFGFFDNYC